MTFSATTDWDVLAAIRMLFAHELRHEAAYGLSERDPLRSALGGPSRGQRIGLGVAAAGIVAAGAVDYRSLVIGTMVVLQTAFVAGRALQAPDVAGRHRRHAPPLAARPRRPRSRQRAAALHGARAGLPRGEHRRRPDRAPAPAGLPAREARDPAPDGGGRPRDDRRGAIGRPARHRPLHPHPRRRAEDQAARVQRRPVLRPRRVRGHLRRRGPARAGPAARCGGGLPAGRRRPGLRPGSPELLQRPPERAHAHVHARVLLLVRLHAARPRPARPADPARRHVQPLPRRPAAQPRRLGRVQRHRGRRPGPAGGGEGLHASASSPRRRSRRRARR